MGGVSRADLDTEWTATLDTDEPDFGTDLTISDGKAVVAGTTKGAFPEQANQGSADRFLAAIGARRLPGVAAPVRHRRRQRPATC